MLASLVVLVIFYGFHPSPDSRCLRAERRRVGEDGPGSDFGEGAARPSFSRLREKAARRSRVG